MRPELFSCLEAAKGTESRVSGDCYDPPPLLFGNEANLIKQHAILTYFLMGNDQEHHSPNGNAP